MNKAEPDADSGEPDGGPGRYLVTQYIALLSVSYHGRLLWLSEVSVFCSICASETKLVTFRRTAVVPGPALGNTLTEQIEVLALSCNISHILNYLSIKT